MDDGTAGIRLGKLGLEMDVLVLISTGRDGGWDWDWTQNRRKRTPCAMGIVRYD